MKRYNEVNMKPINVIDWFTLVSKMTYVKKTSHLPILTPDIADFT
jgi:hypothetical protein